MLQRRTKYCQIYQDQAKKLFGLQTYKHSCFAFYLLAEASIQVKSILSVPPQLEKQVIPLLRKIKKSYYSLSADLKYSDFASKERALAKSASYLLPKLSTTIAQYDKTTSPIINDCITNPYRFGSSL